MAKRVPVLLMTRSLGLGGTERQLTETARLLDRSRFEPHVACFVADGLRRAELEAAGVPILSLPVPSLQSVAAMRAALNVARYIRTHGIQIVHTFDVPMNLFGVPSGRLARTPVVLSSQRAYRNLSSALYRRLLQGLDHVVDGIVVNCEAMRQHLIADEHVPGARIHLCYNGIDTEVFFPAPAERPASFGEATIIGVVCALRPEKDVPTLLRAFSIVRDRLSTLKLLIVGSGPEEAPLRQLADLLGLGDACQFEPATSDVTHWLRIIDIFVLPSLSEALSNSLMEAMACGCCPVASKVGGNPELVEPHATGLLFEAGNVIHLTQQLQLLLEDPPTRKRMAAAASARIQSNFSHRAASQRMADIYTQTLARLLSRG